jgi:hypothetical protein
MADARVVLNTEPDGNGVAAATRLLLLSGEDPSAPHGALYRRFNQQ